MDKQLINEKIEQLRRHVKRLELKKPKSADQLIADIDLQESITLNLTQAVQVAVDIASHIISTTEATAPSTMAGAFEALEKLGVIDHETANNLKKAVGFRNTAVHNYQTIDWKIVFNICQNNIDEFKEFVKQVSQYLN